MGNAGITQNLQALGNYRMASLLSFNEVAATFQGYDHGNNLPSAIVAIHESSLADPSAWERFKEAFTPLVNAGASRVCQAYSCGHDSAHYWASYEWLRGAHLGVAVRDNGLPDAVQAFEWMAQLCEALAILHNRRIRHRILSPASILINDFNQVKLLHAAWGEILLNVTGGLVNPAFGSILPFAAPEVIDGRPAEESADVYSIGANLYFLLTGQPVFWHDDPDVLANLIRTQIPDLSPLEDLAMPEAAELLEELLAHDPEDRPVNLPALSERMKALAQGAAYLAQANEPADDEDAQDEPPQIAPPQYPHDPGYEESGRGLPPRRRPEASQEMPLHEEEQDHQSGLHDIIRQRQEAVMQHAPADAEPPPPRPDAAPAKKSSRGKTLILLGALVLIVAILAGGFAAYSMFLKPEPTPPPAEPVNTANAQQIYEDYLKARDSLRILGNWNRGYYRANGRWPRNSEDLKEVGAQNENLLDPWNNTMEIRGSFVVSSGRDGIWDNDDDAWYDAEKSEAGGYMPEMPPDM